MQIHCCPVCYSQDIHFGDKYINAYTCTECGHTFSESAVEVIYPNFVSVFNPTIAIQECDQLTTDNGDDIPFHL
jgi:ribosomal protein L37AE/L43A